MNIAILSDIHSNCFALEAVLKEFNRNKIDKLIILGDIFGYYPWANETYELLLPYIDRAFIIKGNHDQLLVDEQSPVPIPSYWSAAKQNEKVLKEKNPSVLPWIQSLSFEFFVTVNEISLSMCHGTPNDKKEGRYYPDDQFNYEWLPSKHEILLLGHTHYPIYKVTITNGIVINPGSVGQPRDGNPMPSWGILNLNTFQFQLHRSNYNNLEVMNELEKMKWEKQAIAALNKTQTGKLNTK